MLGVKMGRFSEGVDVNGRIRDEDVDFKKLFDLYINKMYSFVLNACRVLFYMPVEFCFRCL
jgi:hypothetical protein